MDSPKSLCTSASGHCVPGTTTLKRASTRQDAGPVETVYQTFYGHTSQHQAVIVRSDGSATAQYPSEGVAVSVDPEQTGKQFVSAKNRLWLPAVACILKQPAGDGILPDQQHAPAPVSAHSICQHAATSRP